MVSAEQSFLVHKTAVAFDSMHLPLLNHKKYIKADKEAIYSFNDIQATGLHITQYYNIYKTVVIMMIMIKNTKTIHTEKLVHHVRR